MEILDHLLIILAEIDEYLIKTDVNSALKKTHEAIELIKKQKGETI